jgi:rubrerythrin
MDLSNFDEVVNFAIEREEEAADFHKRILQNIHKTGVEERKIADTPNLKISDYVVDVKVKPDMPYADALIAAMKREEKSHQLYSDLAAGIEIPELKKAFEVLAGEELKHKLRLETEYDEYVLKEN